MFTCMGASASNAVVKFGVQMTPRKCVICVVAIVMTPAANRKSSWSIFLLSINFKNCSPASNISRQSATNACARPRILILCVVSNPTDTTVLFNTTWSEQICLCRCLRLSLVERVNGTCLVRQAHPDAATCLCGRGARVPCNAQGSSVLNAHRSNQLVAASALALRSRQHDNLTSSNPSQYECKRTT